MKPCLFVCLALAEAVMSLIAFCIYGADKAKAKKGEWRISEKALLLLAFFLGGIGALLGMKVFRHKTKHLRFRILVPLFAALQVILLAGVWVRFGIG